MKKVHIASDMSITACGLGGWNARVTSDALRVTCRKCLKIRNDYWAAGYKLTADGWISARPVVPLSREVTHG